MQRRDELDYKYRSAVYEVYNVQKNNFKRISSTPFTKVRNLNRMALTDYITNQDTRIMK